jgi:hypothetical protein
MAFDVKKYQVAYRAKNREKNRLYAAAYHKKNRETVLINNRLKYRLNRDLRIAKQIQWQKDNKGYTNAKNKAYKLSKKNRTPKWLTSFDFNHIRAFYEAADFMTKLTGIKFEVDHIIPLNGSNISGLHVPSNLQVIPGIENNKKNNKYKGLS